MAAYDFREIEKKWQEKWRETQNFKTGTDQSKPKFYVLDMFPYPSGAGLHVGHPLGYIASDIVSRYKRNQGFHVLHPMGYDAFGLPAEQYAIQTGQHPSMTTEANINRYREQLDKIGFSFDWGKEIKTCEPEYYKWTQWIFLQLFHSYYDTQEQKAKPIQQLVQHFEKDGNANIAATHDYPQIFKANEWRQATEKQQQEILMHYRLAYLSEASVWWCADLGSVLANDEVVNGVSERGAYPVERKIMKQWSLRITAYADRLLEGLKKLQWSESIKESQRNWIGKSYGCSVSFTGAYMDFTIEVFTTRPDTIFGVSFITLAPEHELVEKIVTPEQAPEVEKYVLWAKNRSERERQADVKKITGVFTGAYVQHPFSGSLIPVWIGDYVLAGYGTGAVMAVPAHDSRDYAFAKHFCLPIIEVVQGGNIAEEAFEAKDGTLIHSDFLNGLSVTEATQRAISAIEEKDLGQGKVNFRLRDAVFGRQRYWGEPIPIYYQDGIPYPLKTEELPLLLPSIDTYLPTETGEPPLARAQSWKYQGKYEYEHTTMPGWAGSSWYFLRYMDPHNSEKLVSEEAVNYWKSVDLYIGGAEHATGHLLYVRFWTKFLYDLGHIPIEEPAIQLVNQGMIQGRSSLIYRVNGTHTYVSYSLRKSYEVTPIHIDVNLVENDILDIEALKRWRSDFEQAEFILENGQYLCGVEIEKMSKRWYNVVNPDDVCEKYGADTFRMYEMFLGPIEQSKPWNTQGITGVHNFLKRFWSLFEDEKGWKVNTDEPTREELKHIHTLLKKVKSDIESLSLNTTVAQYMICCNELLKLKCSKKAILEPFLIALSPFAPHICEELWEKLGHTESIIQANFPEVKEEYLVEDHFEYPVSINGKVKHKLQLPLSLSQEETSDIALQDDKIKELIAGKELRKIIVVHGRIINLVLS